MSELDMDKWSIKLTKMLNAFPHGDRVCKQQGECTCSREVILQPTLAHVAEIMTEVDSLRSDLAAVMDIIHSAPSPLEKSDLQTAQEYRSWYYYCRNMKG